VTENAIDFRRLAGSGKGHHGMILLPSVIGRKAAYLFGCVIPIAEKVFATSKNMFVEIDEDAKITTFQIPRST
jgi:hypothetical protein